MSNGRIVLNDELETMCKEAVVACFNVLSHHLLAGTEKATNKVRTAGLRGEIRTRDLLNTKQECQSHECTFGVQTLKS